MKARHGVIAAAILVSCAAAQAQSYASRADQGGFVTVRGIDNRPLLSYPIPVNPNQRDYQTASLVFSTAAIVSFRNPATSAVFGGLALLSSVAATSVPDNVIPTGVQNVTFFNTDGSVRAYGQYVLTLYGDGRASGGPLPTGVGGNLRYTAVGNNTIIYGNGYGSSMSAGVGGTPDGNPDALPQVKNTLQR